jgi:hypothetical protein
VFECGSGTVKNGMILFERERERDVCVCMYVLVSVVESLTTRREIKGICWSEWKLIRRNKVREKRTGQLGMKWKWKWKWKIQYYYFVTNE